MMMRTTSRLVRGLAAAVLGAALALSAGCGVPPMPTTAPAGQAAPAVPAASAAQAAPPDVTFIIPAGTASADRRGEPIFTIPSELTILKGQSVVIRNDDQAMHYFAEAPIAPGQTYRKVFGQPGAYGYGGVLSCSIAVKKSVTVTVVDQLP